MTSSSHSVSNPISNRNFFPSPIPSFSSSVTTSLWDLSTVSGLSKRDFSSPEITHELSVPLMRSASESGSTTGNHQQAESTRRGHEQTVMLNAKGCHWKSIEEKRVESYLACNGIDRDWGPSRWENELGRKKKQIRYAINYIRILCEKFKSKKKITEPHINPLCY